jgi:uncharacterized protein (DUF1778 family)
MTRAIRLSITVDQADLEIIDEAAQAAQESRSEYLRLSALERARGPEGALTVAQERAVEAVVRRVVGTTQSRAAQRCGGAGKEML